MLESSRKLRNYIKIHYQNELDKISADCTSSIISVRIKTSLVASVNNLVVKAIKDYSKKYNVDGVKVFPVLSFCEVCDILIDEIRRKK